MNSFSQLQNGMNERNAYSMVKNNTLFNEDESEKSQTDQEKEKKKRIALLSFMQ